MSHETLHEEPLEHEHHPKSHASKQGTVSFTLSAKSLFVGGFVLGLLVMGIPATFFATRAAPVPSGSNTGTVTVPSGGAQVPTADPSAARPAGKVKPVSKDDHVRGDANASVTLIEYSDMECPFCKRFHPTVLQLMNEYKGKVKWVYRHFPLSFHANAPKEAEASECAASLGGNDAFWKYTDAIYDRTTSNGTGFALDKLAPLAKEIGLDEQKFKACLDSGRMAQRVQNDFNEGQAAGVDGTPGNILIGKDGTSVMVPGAVPYETLKSQVDQMLAKK